MKGSQCRTRSICVHLGLQDGKTLIRQTGKNIQADPKGSRLADTQPVTQVYEQADKERQMTRRYRQGCYRQAEPDRHKTDRQTERDTGRQVAQAGRRSATDRQGQQTEVVARIGTSDFDKIS
jgi:hypothetical protein